ncbi:immunity protein YezG family protein [Veillonella sp. CHU740]|uniref:immunity protein YezG family protein n=1 Tax=Veillonella sp. CHU740 TaxID=2490950 RepID=UPI000F8F4567|nr:immunity protein YezG family protein [Veillonella sp. CHU740]
MFAEEKKLLMEKKLIQATRELGDTCIPGNWSKILVYAEVSSISYTSSFIVVYNDDSFIVENDLFIISNYTRKNISDLGLKLGEIAHSAYSSIANEEDYLLEFVELELDSDGNSQIYYHELPLEYEYFSTPRVIWQYRKIGYKCRVFWDYEASSLVKKQNITPEKVLKNRIKSIDLVDILNNIIKKKPLYLRDFISKECKNMYFHLDTIGNKERLNIYIEYADNTWIKERNIQSKFAGINDFRVAALYWDWTDEFNSMHTILGKKYTSLDCIFNISTGELSYVYDNVTEDNFTDELALVEAWEKRYFSPDGEPLHTYAIAPHEGCITGTMHIDMSQFIEEEVEEMVDVDPAIEFTGEDIHDLIPQYLQNSYDILYSILPGTFHRVYLYVENDGTVCRQLGYIIVDGEYLTFEEMIDRNVVSKTTYDATMEQMALWSNYMRNAFIACHLEPWTVFSYMLDEELHISNNFGYDVLAEQAYENELFDLWSYEKLGIKSPNLPEDKLANIVPENEYAKF